MYYKFSFGCSECECDFHDWKLFYIFEICGFCYCLKFNFSWLNIFKTKTKLHKSKTVHNMQTFYNLHEMNRE
jgi:hypothetical protein